MRHLFYRNVNARDHLEIFLVSAVSSLEVVGVFERPRRKRRK